MIVLQIPDIPVSEAYQDEHCFMPAYPLTRFLPKFKADRQQAADGSACRKNSRKHPGLTPGVFAYYCGHGRCLGFDLHADKEGPSIPFNTILSRFKQGEQCFLSHVH